MCHSEGSHRPRCRVEAYARGTRTSRFERRGIRHSFCATDEVGISRRDGRHIRPLRVGWVRTREVLRFRGQPGRIAVSREADRSFASVLFELTHATFMSQFQPRVGVDLGITTPATLGTGR